MKTLQNKFRIIQVKTCSGSKADFFSSSTNDINVAFHRIANLQKRINETGRHTTGYYSGCTRGHYGVKCKAQFEVREFTEDLNSKKKK